MASSSVTNGVGAKKDWRGGSSVVKNQGAAAPSVPASYNTSSGNHTAPPKQAISGIVVRR
jgi:hypothetical protein